jgi:hypothetical protein
VLEFDGTFDAFSTENVLASSNDWVMELVETDGTFVAAVDAELK